MNTEIERPKMVEYIPPMECGSARVEHFVITEKEAKHHNRMLELRPGTRFDHVSAGKYARLHVAGASSMFSPMMSDTDMEWTTNRDVIRAANGDVLIGGLGLGFILRPILAKPEVTSVTVLEINGDVIDLVYPRILQAGWPGESKLTIKHADALKWQAPKGVKWDTIYFDLWPEISTDNWPEIVRLKQRFARRLDRKNDRAWMGFWREWDMNPRIRRW